MENKKLYSTLLHRKEWKIKREIILKRDCHRCTCCGSGDKLIVHHKYYNNYPNGKMVNPWEYPNYALETLCYVCHRKVHKTTRIVVRYIPYK